MYNIGLKKYENATIENFTSDLGLKLRRTIHKPLRIIVKLATKGNIIVQNYPKLEQNKPYIFAATHSFVEEVPAILSTIDRSVYSLIGTKDQLEHNPRIYANWLMGIIYVDRFNKTSRKESIQKMERVLNSGTSVLVFPEGGWNNTENLLCQELFASPYILSKDTGCKVVPISTFNEFGSKDIVIKVDEPLELYKYTKKAALKILRDNLATMMYAQIEEYSTPIYRENIGIDPRLNFMEERKKEYQKVNWTRDVFDEELTRYIDRDNPIPEQIRASLDNVELNMKNAKILAPILVKRLEDKKYDFKSYMHENWDKK